MCSYCRGPALPHTAQWLGAGRAWSSMAMAVTVAGWLDGPLTGQGVCQAGRGSVRSAPCWHWKTLWCIWLSAWIKWNQKPSLSCGGERGLSKLWSVWPGKFQVTAMAAVSRLRLWLPAVCWSVLPHSFAALQKVVSATAATALVLCFLDLAVVGKWAPSSFLRSGPAWWHAVFAEQESSVVAASQGLVPRGGQGPGGGTSHLGEKL